jgi:hypothetical protein
MSKITTKPDAPGVIDGGLHGEFYTVAEFCRRVRMRRYAFDQARRNGLVVIEVGRSRYVRGSDWARFLEQQAEKQAASVAD